MAMQYLGDIEIEYITLSKVDRTSINRLPAEKIDISNIVLTFNVVASMFKPSIYATVTIADGMKLKEDFPILGQELLEIKFRTPDYVQTPAIPGALATTRSFKSITLKFIVSEFNPEMKAETAGNPSLLQLGLISVDEFTNNFLRLSRGYHQGMDKNNPVGGTPGLPGNIRDFIEIVLTDELNTSKVLKILDTNNPDVDKPIDSGPYALPRMKPFDKIKLLTSRACHPAFSLIEQYCKNTSAYVFYETFDSYRFNTIDYMIEIGSEKWKATPKKYKYYYNPTISSSHIFTEFEYMNIGQYINVSNFSNIRKLSKGFHSIQPTIYDMNGLRYQFLLDPDQPPNFDYKLHKVFNSLTFRTKMGYRYFNNTENYLKSLEKYPGFRTFLVTDLAFEDYYDEVVTSSSVVATALMQDPVSVAIFGNTDLEVGDLIEIEIPGAGSLNPVGNKYTDKLQSGVYLITQMMHSFSGETTQATFSTRLDLTRIGNSNDDQVMKDADLDNSGIAIDGVENSDQWPRK